MRSMSSAQRQVELILLGNIIVTTRNINGSEIVYFVIQDHLLYLFVKLCVFCQDIPVSMVEFASESRDEQLRLYPRDHDFILTVITCALRLRRDELIGQERGHVM